MYQVSGKRDKQQHASRVRLSGQSPDDLRKTVVSRHKETCIQMVA
jgi:hypothetical protein